MAAVQEVQPPSARQVMRRAMILGAVTCRCFIDHDPENSDAQVLWQRLHDWIKSLGVDSEIEPHESRIILSRLGTLPDTEKIRGTWSIEGAAILAWALGLRSYPLHDTQVDPYEVTDALGLLDPDAADFVQLAELRPIGEVTACRELLYAIHCRIREFNRDGVVRNREHWIEEEWLQTLGVNGVLTSDGDLSADGLPISKCRESDRALLEAAICERHRAAIWLIGESGPVYSEVPVDT